MNAWRHQSRLACGARILALIAAILQMLGAGAHAVASPFPPDGAGKPGIGTFILICTPAGYKRLEIGADGQPVGQDQDSGRRGAPQTPLSASGSCHVCVNATANSMAPVGDVDLIKHAIALEKAQPQVPTVAPLYGLTQTTGQPRAPPASV